ncbi:hypothetical protein ACHAXS_004272 [Conticribra weissflogii]
MAELKYRKSRVGNEPKIFFGSNMKLFTGKTAAHITASQAHNNPSLEAQGDSFVNGFWVSRTTCILDVRITNVHASSYKKHPPAWILKNAKASTKKRSL